MRHLCRAGLPLLAVLVSSLGARPTVQLMVPPPGRYGIENLWRARVTSDSDYSDVWFEGFVFEAMRGQVFHATTIPFALARGTRMYSYQDVTIDRTETTEGYEVFATRSGQLPAGSYRFRLVLMPFGIGDSSRFDVRPISPPRLLQPRAGETLATRYPSFAWTAPAPMPRSGFSYELVIAEQLPGQGPAEALRASPAWFSRQGLTATTFRYPTSGRDLVPGHEYAWQVNVRRGRDVLAASEARRFAVGAARTMLTREQVIAIILAQVIKPDSLTEDLLAFLGREPLEPGDRVREAFDSTETTIRQPTWFAWLNDDPTAEFGHPMRYVFVDAFSGDVTVQQHEFWPVVNDEHIWQTREELAGDRFIFFERPERK